ncbi:hypothetical protein [Bacterioplanoides sp.]|uniref:hypothetical protein n=1 Tax=Bacterioplanoides sp. TaxID=2066072 RepID=UPI003B59A48A
MNSLNPLQNNFIAPDRSARQEPQRSERPVREQVKRIDEVEVVSADISDLEFLAQQQAEQQQQRQSQSRESNAFLQTQDLQSEGSLGRFIDIQA